MKLVRLKLANVGAIADGDYALVDRRTGRPLDVVIVTGGPASGKTTLLEAIIAAKEGVGAYGPPPDGSRLLRSGKSSGRIEATWWLSAQEVERAELREPAARTVLELRSEGRARSRHDSRLERLFASYSHDADVGKVDYFPDNRQLVVRSWSPMAPPLSEQAEARERLGRDPDKYAPVIRSFVDLAVEQGLRANAALAERGIALRLSAPDAFGPLRAAIARILPDLRFAAVEPRDGAPRVLFERRDGTQVALERLSAFEQQGVLFAVSFWRIGLEHSLVLVDEPELHVHPREQARFLRAIVGLGSDNQVIVATGSEAIVQEATPWQLVDLSIAPAVTVHERYGRDHT
jgi:predicted ATPase